MSGTVFSGVRAGWAPLYARFLALARHALGAFEVRETSAGLIWAHTSAFAEITARRDCMVVGFASDTVHDEWMPAKVLQTSKNRVAHYFEVTDEDDFPVLLERIAASYALTRSARPRRTEAAPAYQTVDEYLALFSGEVRAILDRTRETIRAAAPNATEKISWKMPTWHQRENLIHFAAAKHHLGIYPGERAIEVFADKLTAYKTTRGAIQFPFSAPIPYDLIAALTRFRVSMVTEGAT